jgi:hypothetical protein
MLGTALRKAVDLAHLPAKAAAEVFTSTSAICELLKSKPAGKATALIVGRIQSGKTLSFTTLVAAMADHGVRIVVVLGGTKKLLVDQTRQRLRAGLDERRFAVLDRARDVSHLLPRGETNRFFPPRTLVFVILKNPRQINRLAKDLKSIGPGCLGQCMIIDDEADAAGLNTMLREGDQSATYKAISTLRATIEQHWYVQYTATPQANLLIPLVDHLSPDCVHVLMPGADYVGADVLLAEPHAVQAIPTRDGVEMQAGRCPPGLAAALMQFFVALAFWAKTGRDGCISMMVHPSQFTRDHSVSENMIRSRIGYWMDLSESGDAACIKQLTDEVEAGCEDLARTCHELRDHVDAHEIAMHFSSLVEEVQVRVINSTVEGSAVDWIAARGWILVGGASLDRGFTVEGLTVTYMPRSAGQGNVDTLQQRGRFFGYIRRRLRLVRVHLEADVLELYGDIAKHEAHMHDWLVRAAADARDVAGVRALRREFVLTEQLQPTRRVVIDPAVQDGGIPAVVWHQSAPANIRLSEANGCEVEEWVQAWKSRGGELAWVGSDEAGQSRRHQIARSVPVVDILELVRRVKFGCPKDTERWLSAAASIAVAQKSIVSGSIMLMRPNASPERAVIDGELRSLLQGRGESNDYLGDRAVAEGAVCLQLHRVHIRQSDGKLLGKPLPVVALVLSDEARARVVTLDPGGVRPAEA